jgi:hypothetical protein
MAEIKDPENTLVVETTQGTMTIEMLPDLAPGTSRGSRNWPGKAPMTASCSTASSRASWRRPAT